MDLAGAVSMVATNGIGVACAALVVWLAWYRETRTIPAMMDHFAESQNQNVKAFAAAQKLALENFATMVREERANYERWHTENRARLDALATELRGVVERRQCDGQ